MLTRILSAVVALPLFILLVFFAPEAVLMIAVALLNATACYEMLHTTGLVKSRLLLTVALILAAAILPVTVYTGIDSALAILFSGMCLLITAVASRSTVDYREIFYAFLSAVFIPLALGSVFRLRMQEHGKALVLLPFLAAWLTDTFAYFTGVFFGRHHIAPKISPKKTIEGCIGGTVLCTVVSLLYIPLAHAVFDVTIPALPLALIMFTASIISQFGDLSMSYIKRGASIKDYGKIMPGHGGVLDRFDSVLFSATVVEIWLYFINFV